MELNLPVSNQLLSCKNLLIAGMGGGFDVFCGLPIYFQLRSQGKIVHLANLSFSLLSGLDDSLHLTDDLLRITADHQSWLPYFPELYLAQWFHEKQGEDMPIWCFKKTGVRPLLKSYQALVKYLSIDGILLIDGGVDSLLRGNEAHIGTILEDSISLSAVSQLDHVPVRLLGCLGLGAEQNIAHTQIFENIASLAKAEAFLGSCSLVKQMEAYQRYEEALRYVQGNPRQEASVINSSIISAIQGEYGDYHLTAKTSGSKLWISPLMPIY
jgi:hypothetical protein